MKFEQYLVSGSRGFIGSALVEFLADKQKKIVRVERHSGEPEFEAELAKNTCLFHIAGLAHDTKATKSALWKANVEFTEKVFEKAIRSCRLQCVIFISTIGVYGLDWSSEVIDEETSVSPAADYSEVKLIAEQRLCRLCLEYQVKWVILRPALVAGGYNAPGNLSRLIKFFDRARVSPLGLANEPRSMCSIDNLVSVLWLVSEHPKAEGQIFNVVDDELFSTVQLVELLSIHKCLNLRVPRALMYLVLSLLGKRRMYYQLFCRRVVDNQKLKSLLGWKPALARYSRGQCGI